MANKAYPNRRSGGDSDRENDNYSVRGVKSAAGRTGVEAPRIGGKYAKGDSRSRSMTGGLTQGKNRGGQY